MLQLLYPCLICEGYSSAVISMNDLSAAVSMPDVSGYISSAVFMPDFSGVFSSCCFHARFVSCCFHAWCARGILQLFYPCLMCQGYTSAVVSMPGVSGIYFSYCIHDFSGVCLSCSIHSWFVRGMLQLLYPWLIFQGYSAVAVSMPDLSAAVSMPDVLGV